MAKQYFFAIYVQALVFAIMIPVAIRSRFALRDHRLSANSPDKSQDNLRYDICDFVSCGSALDPEVRSPTQIVHGGG
jgi:hypothetical protein